MRQAPKPVRAAIFVSCFFLAGCGDEVAELRRDVAVRDQQLEQVNRERGALYAQVGHLEEVVRQSQRKLTAAEIEVAAQNAELEQLKTRLAAIQQFAEHRDALEAQRSALLQENQDLKREAATNKLRLTELDRLRARYTVLQQSRPASYLSELARLQIEAGAEDEGVLSKVRLVYEATKAPVVEEVVATLRLTIPNHLYLPLGDVVLTFAGTSVKADKAQIDMERGLFSFEFPRPAGVLQAFEMSRSDQLVVTIGPIEYHNELVFVVGGESRSFVKVEQSFELYGVRLAGQSPQIRPPYPPPQQGE